MKSEFDFSLERPVHGEEMLGGTGQLARASWLAKRIREDNVYFMQDGTLSEILFKEILSSFVAGQFIATIILGFSLIERTVAGRLAFVGDKAESAKSEHLLSNALERKWLGKEEYEQLDELRKSVRNPIVHFRDYLNNSRPESRAAMSARTTEQLLEADAKRILEATIRLLQKIAI
jgi:hypothetical protein